MKTFKELYLKRCSELQVHHPISNILELDDSISKGGVLDLSELTLGSNQLDAICHALKISGSVFSKINFSETYIGDEGCSTLCSALKGNTELRVLYLSGSNIQSKGAVSISDLLRETSSIQELYLEWNSCGILEIGIGSIADSLKSNKSLLRLDVRNNRIGAEGALKLANALKINQSLRHLDLRWNSVGSSGADYLREGLEDNFTLQTLHLSGNEVDFDTMEKIESLLGRNKEYIEEEKQNEEFERKLTSRLSEVHIHQKDEISRLQDQLDQRRMEYEGQREMQDKRVVEMRENLTEDSFRLQDLVSQMREKDLTISQLENEKKFCESQVLSERKLRSEEIDKIRLHAQGVEKLKDETSVMLEKTTRELASANIDSKHKQAENLRLREVERRLSSEVEDVQKRVITMEEREKALSREKHKLEQREKSLSSTVEELQLRVQRMTGIEEKFKDRGVEMKQLENRLTKQIDEMKAKYETELLDIKRNHEERLLRENSEKSKLSIELNTKRSQMSTLQQRLDNERIEKEKKVREMKSSLEMAAIERGSLESEKSRLLAEIEQNKFSLKKMSEINMKNQENSEREMKKLNEQLKRLEDNHEKEKDEFSKKLKRMERDIEEMSTKNNDLRVEIKKVKEENESVLLEMENEIVGFVKKVIRKKTIS